MLSLPQSRLGQRPGMSPESAAEHPSSSLAVMRLVYAIGPLIVLAVVVIVLLPDGPGLRGGIGALIMVFAGVEAVRVVMLGADSARRIGQLVLALAAVAAGVALAESWRICLVAALTVTALFLRSQLSPEADSPV